MKIKVILLIEIIFIGIGLSQEKLEIVNADTIRGEKTSAGIVRYMEGNVHLRQGKAELFCEQVTWFVEQHQTILQKDVKFIDGAKVLTAKKVYYYDQTRIAEAVGDVVVIDSLHQLHANHAVYHENEDKIVANENIVLSDNENAVVLTGQYAEFYSEDEYALVKGKPALIKKDSTDKEEIRVTGELMELFDGGQQAIVTQNVIITLEEGKSTSDRAEYFRADDRLLLTGNPEVWQKYDKLTGDAIELFLEKDKLKKVIINKNAFVASRVDTMVEDSRLNTLSGDKITLHISENRLSKVEVEGKATCYYHIVEKNEYKGLNKIIGDRIIMDLEQGKIQNITISSDPGSSSGMYYPPGFEPGVMN